MNWVRSRGVIATVLAWVMVLTSAPVIGAGDTPPQRPVEQVIAQALRLAQEAQGLDPQAVSLPVADTVRASRAQRASTDAPRENTAETIALASTDALRDHKAEAIALASTSMRYVRPSSGRPVGMRAGEGTVELSMGDLEILEAAGTVYLPITLSGPSPVEATYEAFWDGCFPDETSFCTGRTATTIHVGDTTGQIAFFVGDDNAVEPTRHITVTLSGGAPEITVVDGEALVTVLDDDAAAPVAFDLFDGTATGPAFVNAYLLGQLSADMYADQIPSPFQASFENRWGERGLQDFTFIDDDTTGTQAYAMRAPDAYVVAFRGTEFVTEFRDVLADADTVPVTVNTPSGDVIAHRGFWTAASSVIDEVKDAIEDDSEGQPVWLTGNSLGGAMAAVVAMQLELDGIDVAGTHVFGAPNVGDQAFVDTLGTMVGAGRIQRWVNSGDPIARIPPIPFRPAGSTNFFTHNSDDVRLTIGSEPSGLFVLDLNDHFQGRYNNHLWPHVQALLTAEEESLLPEPGRYSLDDVELAVVSGALAGIIRAMLPYFSVEQIAVMLIVPMAFALDVVVQALVAAGVTALPVIAAALAAAAVPLATIVGQLVAIGANAVGVATAIFPALTTSVATVADLLYTFEQDYLRLAQALKAITDSVSLIASQLHRLGADAFELAEALFKKVTTNVITIAKQVDRWADPETVLAALLAKVTTVKTKLVEALVALNLEATEVALLIHSKLTTQIDEIVLLLEPYYPAAAIATALTALGLGAAAVAAAIMGPLSLTFSSLAVALDAVVGVTTLQIALALVSLEAPLGQVVNALEAMGRSLDQIADVLDDIPGVTTPMIADLLDDYTSATLGQIVNALEHIGRGLVSMINALEDIRTAAQIMEALDDYTTATFSELGIAFDEATDLLGKEIANLLDDMTAASTGTIVDVLQAMGRELDTIAGALEYIGRSVREMVDALDDFTGAGYSTIANAVRDGTAATYRQIVDALDVKTSASLSEIASALDHAGAGYTTIMRALEQEMSVTRYDTAKQIHRLGAGINTIISALIEVYDAGYDSVWDVLEFLGYSFDSIAGAICDYFDC